MLVGSDGFAVDVDSGLGLTCRLSGAINVETSTRLVRILLRCIVVSSCRISIADVRNGLSRRDNFDFVPLYFQPETLRWSRAV